MVDEGHPFDQVAGAPVRVCWCGKWPDHHIHTGDWKGCACDECRVLREVKDDLNELVTWFRGVLDGNAACTVSRFRLADIAAKRAVLDLVDKTGYALTITDTVRLLAAAYDRWPGYREEWRP